MIERVKPYLSYSQYSTFNSSPAQYIRTYIYKIRLKSKYLDFGSLIGEALEDREKIFQNPSVEMARELIPCPTEREKKIEIDFEGIPVLGYLDGFWGGDIAIGRGETIIDEYKTSKRKWTQAMVDKSEQITFYAIMVSREFHIRIRDIKINLYWLETMEDIDGSVFLTGKVEKFETQRTTADGLSIYPKMKHAWDGIGELVTAHFNQKRKKEQAKN